MAIYNAALGPNRLAPQPRDRSIQDADHHYHKQVVDGFVNGLRKAGVVIIVEVDLVAVNGLTARADFMGMLPAFGGIVMTEIKTSLTFNDYDEFDEGGALRRFQADVYRLVPMGNHVTSPNAKVSQLGLTPGKPFPPMRLDYIQALPGQAYNIRSYPPGTIIPAGVL